VEVANSFGPFIPSTYGAAPAHFLIATRNVSSAMPRARQFSRVQFHVEAPLGHGQAIFVTGSGPALGDNDALSGVALYTTPAEYPRWSSDWGRAWDGIEKKGASSWEVCLCVLTSCRQALIV